MFKAHSAFRVWNRLKGERVDMGHSRLAIIGVLTSKVVTWTKMATVNIEWK